MVSHHPFLNLHAIVLHTVDCAVVNSHHVGSLYRSVRRVASVQSCTELGFLSSSDAAPHGPTIRELFLLRLQQ